MSEKEKELMKTNGSKLHAERAASVEDEYHRSEIKGDKVKHIV